MSRHKNISPTYLFCILTGVGISQAALADDSAQCPELSCLQEIKVTAQGYKNQTLQVPMSISTQSGNALDRKRIHSLAELAIETPGVSFYEEGPGKASFNIRGISSTVGSSTVSILLDDISLTSFNTFQVNPDLYDLERSEVLRGPQGTLYGEGSLGGTIRLISNKPNFQNPEAKLRLSQFSPFQPNTPNKPDGGHRYDAVFGFPLIKDRVAIRAGISRSKDGGYIDQPQRGIKNANDVEKELGRFTVSALLTQRSLVEATYLENRLNYGALNRGNSNFEQAGKVDTRSNDRFNAASLKLTQSFDKLDLELSTNTYKRKFMTRQDGIADLERLIRLDPSLNPVTDSLVRGLVDNVPIVDNGIQDKQSKELRILTTGTGPIKVIAGLYGEENKTIYNPVWNTNLTLGVSDQQLLALLQMLNPASQSAPQGILLDADYNSISSTLAGFFNLDYEIREGLTLSLGTRRTRQHLTGDTRGVFLGLPITGDIHETFYVNTPRLAISQQFSNALINQGMVYLSAAKGFRAGGANNRVDNEVISQQDNVQPFYEPDTLWTYELGSKVRLLDKRLTLQGSYYRNDWRNVQSATISSSGLVPFITNVGNAAGSGTDFQLDYAFNSKVLMYFSAAFNNMAFTTSSPQKAAGDPMDYNPAKAYSLGLQYRQRGIFGGGLTYNLDYAWRDRIALTPTAGNTRWSDIVRLINARVAFDTVSSGGKRFEFALFVKNLGNFKGRLDPNFNDTSEATQAQARIRPRTLGIEAQMSY